MIGVGIIEPTDQELYMRVIIFSGEDHMTLFLALHVDFGPWVWLYTFGS